MTVFCAEVCSRWRVICCGFFFWQHLAGWCLLLPRAEVYCLLTDPLPRPFASLLRPFGVRRLLLSAPPYPLAGCRGSVPVQSRGPVCLARASSRQQCHLCHRYGFVLVRPEGSRVSGTSATTRAELREGRWVQTQDEVVVACRHPTAGPRAAPWCMLPQAITM